MQGGKYTYVNIKNFLNLLKMPHVRVISIKPFAFAYLHCSKLFPPPPVTVFYRYYQLPSDRSRKA